MKTIEHKTKIIEFEVFPCSKIDDVAKDVVEYIQEWNVVVKFKFNDLLIYADKKSTVQSIVNDYYCKCHER